MSEEPLKTRTVRALKWNVADRISTQVIYAVTGIVLARELSPNAFGLIGVLLVFQSFALMLVDSGFSFALVQKQKPTEQDYCSVFWFNLLMSCGLYVILFTAMPWIAELFGNQQQLVSLGRVMFLSIVINALSIVQVNRLMKQMNVRPIAVSNFVSLAAGGGVGVAMAYGGYGAWSLVAQTLTINSVKVFWLICYSRWIPAMEMRKKVLQEFFHVGSGMMGTSFLNVLFQNIYSFVIGNRSGMTRLGYYTQADKWSKMGITSITQIITSTFLPTLSEVQNDRERFMRVARRAESVIVPVTLLGGSILIILTPAIFHLLFGAKWDASISLFILLIVRGMFTILTSLCNTYMLSLGKSKPIFLLELFRDLLAIGFLIPVLPLLSIGQENIVSGIEEMLLWQILASVITWLVTLIVTCRITGLKLFDRLLIVLIYGLISIILLAISYMLT